MFSKFSFHEKICFWNFLILNYFFSKEIIFQNFHFFSKKMLVANFMRFRRKRLKKQTHIDNFSLKKIWNEFIWLFFVHQNCKTKKLAISKVSKKKFRKIHDFANIKYERNLPKYCEKNLRRNIFVKRKIFTKKNSIKKIFTKKKICRKKLVKKNLLKKKSKKF